MADYIDRQWLKDCVNDGWIKFDTEKDENRFIYLVRFIAPSADAIEVVRCADCKYYQDNNDGYPHEECRWGHDETPNEDDYCSYGERKE